MMKQVLKAGPNQMETLRRLRTEAAAIDKDVTVRSERSNSRPALSHADLTIFIPFVRLQKQRCQIGIERT